MKTPTRVVFFFVFAAFLMSSGTRTYADSVSLTYSGAGVTGDVVLTLTPDGSGVFSVTGISGTVNGSAVEGLIPISGPASTTVLDGQTFTYYQYDSDAFTYDNLFYTTGSTSVVDLFDPFGLLFNVNGFSSPVDLFYCGSVFGDTCSGAYQGTVAATTPITIDVVSTPEPSSAFLSFCGILFGWMMFLGKRLYGLNRHGYSTSISRAM